MRIAHAFILSVLLFAAVSFKGDRKEFPAFKGVTLSGKSISLPDADKRRFTLLGCAYSVEAQDNLYTWAQPVYDHLMDNPMFPVDVYFIAMTGKIKTMSQDKIKAKMRAELDPELYPYIIVYQDNPQAYIDALEMSDKKEPYFFVLDPEGKISYSTSGEFTEEKFEEVTDALSE